MPLARWSLSELQSQVLTPNDFASLTDEMAGEIRARYVPRRTMHSLAKYYNVARVTVWNVVHGVTWKHVA